MDRLRDLLGPRSDPAKSHDYLQERLLGFETESFGAEVARLSLMLADFPNPNGWRISHGDVDSPTTTEMKLAFGTSMNPTRRKPAFSSSQLDEVSKCVSDFREALDAMLVGGLGRAFYEKTGDLLLKRIDASVMKAYNLPARMERAVLDFFNGQLRVGLPSAGAQCGLAPSREPALWCRRPACPPVLG